MPPDHPYLNVELAEKRAAQRRVLRSIPDWLVENVQIGRPGPRLRDPDGALLETELRRLADWELEPLKNWLYVWRLHTESEMTERWFRNAEIGAALEEVASRVRSECEARRTPEYPPGLYPAILRVVTLLAWADEQAGNYADPRLVQFHTHWRDSDTRVA